MDNKKIIADNIPSYFKWKDYIYLNNWDYSLENCLSQGKSDKFHYSEIDFRDHNDKIIELWFTIIKRVSGVK